jgi:hypothetical protein
MKPPVKHFGPTKLFFDNTGLTKPGEVGEILGEGDPNRNPWLAKILLSQQDKFSLLLE